MNQPAALRFCTALAIALAALLHAAPALAKDDCPESYRDYPMKKTIKLAENGCLNAILWMTSGNYIDPKLGNIEKTPEEQIMWLERAAAAGHAVSMLEVAELYAFGEKNTRIYPKDEAKALQYAEAALATGQLVSSTVHPYHDTKGRAIRLIADLKQMAALRDKTTTDGAAAYGMFRIMQTNMIWGARAHWLKIAADLGNKEAMDVLLADNENQAKNEDIRYQYGIRYVELHGPRSNPDENTWLAFRLLISKYDLPRARALFPIWAKAGVPGTQAAAQLLTNAKYYALFESAVIDKSPEANLVIGDEIIRRKTTDKDVEYAMDFFRSARRLGHPLGLRRVAEYATPGYAEHRDALAELAAKGDTTAGATLGQIHAKDAENRRLAEEREYAAAKRAYEAGAQRQSEYVARIDREGAKDSYEIEVYCMYGGSRCQTLRTRALQIEKANNAAWDAANAQRLQQVYSGGAGTTDAQYKARSDCMQRKTQAIQNNTKGQADHFNADCSNP